MLMTIYWCGVGAYLVTAACLLYKMFHDPDILKLTEEMQARNIHSSFLKQLSVFLWALVPIAHWLYAVGFFACVVDSEFWIMAKMKVQKKAEEMMK